MAVGRRACPSRRLRRRSTSWSSSVSDSMSSTQAPSRLKQIDGRSRTGNVNLLKLGGPTSASAEPSAFGSPPLFGQSVVITSAPPPARPCMSTTGRGRAEVDRKTQSADLEALGGVPTAKEGSVRPSAHEFTPVKAQGSLWLACPRMLDGRSLVIAA